MSFSPFSFDIEVIFGAPGKRCEGAGICQIIPVGPVRVHWKCPSTRARLVAVGESKICIIFPKKDLREGLAERYFAGNFFEVEESYVLPIGISSKFKFGDFRIPSGRYLVKVSEVNYEIEFLNN